MLVRQSVYDAMERRALRAEKDSNLYQLEFFKLQNKWNSLIARINEKGGEALLNGKYPNNKTQPQFSDDELTKIIMLCHPDKHDGKPMATEMTQKLLSIKARK